MIAVQHTAQVVDLVMALVEINVVNRVARGDCTEMETPYPSVFGLLFFDPTGIPVDLDKSAPWYPVPASLPSLGLLRPEEVVRQGRQRPVVVIGARH
jgi:hypothetical protein